MDFYLTEESWLELMCDPKVFKEEDLAILNWALRQAGSICFSQIANEFGRTAEYYYEQMVKLARRIAKKANSSFLEYDGKPQKVLFPNFIDYGENTNLGVFWDLHRNILNALTHVTATTASLYTDKWPNIYLVDTTIIPEGITTEELSKLEKKNRLVNRRNSRKSDYTSFYPSIHDWVILHENGRVKALVEIVSPALNWKAKGPDWSIFEFRLLYTSNDITINAANYSVFRSKSSHIEVFTDKTNRSYLLSQLLTPCFGLDYEKISKECKKHQNQNDSLHNASSRYTSEDFLKEVHLNADKFDDLIDTLKEKKNIILQGAPGVGKTYIAKRLAYAMMGEKNDDRIKFVQFHQSYTYEDFIEGYRPDGDKFIRKEGTFAEFCWDASIEPKHDFFFIIDEINRGNVSKIFGELLMLIEKDYRNTSASLVYSRKAFSIPDNLYIIGMMNTADRSLATLDYALRRRFAFFDMEPAFDTDSFKSYQSQLGSEAFDNLIQCVKALNHEISNDASLGDGFCIGHSYFCNKKPDEITQKWIKSVVNHDILPTLREYWFEGDDRKTLAKWEDKLKGATNE